jgi:hypothetical protein
MLIVTGDHKNPDETKATTITVCSYGIHGFCDANIVSTTQK